MIVYLLHDSNWNESHLLTEDDLTAKINSVSIHSQGNLNLRRFNVDFESLEELDT